MTDFKIREVNVDSDDDMRMLNDLERDCDLELFGGAIESTVEERRAIFAPLSYKDRKHWVAEVPGAFAGIAMVGMPTQENTDTADVGLAVHPDYRGQGIGRALATTVADYLAGTGRTKVTTYGWAPTGVDIDSPELPWNKLATILGVQKKNSATMKTLPLPMSESLLDELEATVPDHDYRVQTWVGMLPDDQLENFGVITRQLELDEPTGDYENTVTEYSAERVREMLQKRLDTGSQHLVSMAFAPDGTVAAGSDIEFRDSPNTTLGWQENTLVMPEHRGHRLGIALKVANHRKLNELAPRLTALATGNSNLNEHMNAINEKFGFRPAYTEIAYQS